MAWRRARHRRRQRLPRGIRDGTRWVSSYRCSLGWFQGQDVLCITPTRPAPALQLGPFRIFISDPVVDSGALPPPPRPPREMDAPHFCARAAGISLGSSVAATRRATWRLALPALLPAGAASACAVPDAVTGPKTATAVLRFSGDTQLVVGDTAAFAIAAEIDGAPVSTPRFRFTIEDTLVASRTAAGDSIVGRRRGRTNLVASLTSPMLPTPPTLRVALNVVVGAVGVVPASDTLTSIDDTLSLAAPTFDAHDVPITGASATWVSSDTTVAVFVAPGRLVARRNGQVTVQALVDNDTGTGSIVIAQRLARVQASTPVVVLSALTAESTLVASGVDARGHLLSGVPISWSSEASTIASVTPAVRVRG